MGNVSIVRYSPATADEATTDKLITCYQHVFAGSPWYESWPYDQVKSDLLHEITDKTSCWIATKDALVVGFCWGYPIKVLELEKKLGIECNIDTNQVVAYQDEVGVSPEYRGQKIAKAMVHRRLQDFIAQGLDYGIVRTRVIPEPSLTFGWYQRLGYSILARYDDGRVVLGRKFEGLLEQLSA